MTISVNETIAFDSSTSIDTHGGGVKYSYCSLQAEALINLLIKLNIKSTVLLSAREYIIPVGGIYQINTTAAIYKNGLFVALGGSRMVPALPGDTITSPGSHISLIRI